MGGHTLFVRRTIKWNGRSQAVMFSGFFGKFHGWDPNLGKLGLTKRKFRGIQRLDHIICELKMIEIRQNLLKDRLTDGASSPLSANGPSGNNPILLAASVFQ